MSNKFQNEDFKTQVELEAAGGTKAQLLNDTKIYVTANGIAKTLDQAIIDGDIGGSGGVGGADIMATDTADKASLGQYTQTGLEIITTPVILHGTKSFRLIHQAASTRSFKKILPVDKKFRGKAHIFDLDVVSTALSANLTLYLRDETNGVDVLLSSPITTASQTISCATNTNTTLSGFSTSDFGKLKLGMSITGPGIQTGTTITGLSINALTATISLPATSSATATRTVSALTTKRSFGFFMPEGCLSFSWTISALQEANLPESYIDDIIISLAASAMTSTTITVPKNNNFKDLTYTPSISGNSNISGTLKYSRYENIMRITGNLAWTGAGTTSVFNVPLPNALNTPLNPGVLLGPQRLTDTGNQNWTAIASTFSNGFQISGFQSSGSGILPYPALPFTPNAGDFVEINVELPITEWLVNETETKTIPLTTAVIYQQPDTYLSMANGTLSGNVSNLDFNAVQKSIGSGIRYDGTLRRFIALEEGLFNVSATDEAASTAQNKLFIVANQGGTDNYVAEDDNSTVQYRSSVAAPVYLFVGDYIRIEASNSRGTGGSRLISISKVGSAKILNPSLNQKIDIPTHEIRFIDGSGRGTIDTGIVKFDTIARIKGDAWDVLNSATNGTVITMKKAGRLSVNYSISLQAGGQLTGVTLNQVNLTSAGNLTSEVVAADMVASANYGSGSSATIDVAVGDKIRVFADGPISIGESRKNQLSLNLMETSVGVALSNVLPQFTDSDSAVRLYGGNGMGSINTQVRRFASVATNIGSDIIYTDSATLGATFLINTPGIYTISYGELSAITNALNFILKNSLVANNGDETLATFRSTSNTIDLTTATISVYLQKGDIIRAVSNGADITAGQAYARFSITKVGKPNLTGVDIIPFVNIPRDEIQYARMVDFNVNSPSVATKIAWFTNIETNTNNGLFKIETDGVLGTRITALKRISIQAGYTISFVSNQDVGWTVNSTELTTDMNATTASTRRIMTRANANEPHFVAVNTVLEAGDILRPHTTANTRGALSSTFQLNITATASSDNIATPTKNISTDTMNFIWSSTAINANSPIGTFNTYTKSASAGASTNLVTSAAPTQSLASMNINGMLIYPGNYTNATTAAQPSRIDVQIGKFLTGIQIECFNGGGKTLPCSYEMTNNQQGAYYGVRKMYDPNSGILTIDAGAITSNATIAFIGLDTQGNTVTSGYFTVSASTAPSLVALPNLQPRIALIKYDTSGVRMSLSTTYAAVPLTSIIDPTGIASINSNQILLQPGQYKIDGEMYIQAGSAGVVAIANLANITSGLVETYSMPTSLNASGYSAITKLSKILTANVATLFEIRAKAAAGTAFVGDTYTTESDKALITITKLK